MKNVYDFSVTTIDGRDECLEAFRGQTLLIVNVASRCGFTPQYAGLEALYRNYREQRFTILGFPCDQFGNQEPGDEAEIKAFCTISYDVTFPLFAKVAVNGPTAHPLYRYLTSTCRGVLWTRSIKWNFTKFLVDSDGNAVHRYAPTIAPERIERDLRRWLPAIRP